MKKAKAKTDDGDEGADGIASLVGSTGFAHAFIATLRYVEPIWQPHPPWFEAMNSFVTLLGYCKSN